MVRVQSGIHQLALPSSYDDHDGEQRPDRRGGVERLHRWTGKVRLTRLPEELVFISAKSTSRTVAPWLDMLTGRRPRADWGSGRALDAADIVSRRPA